MKTYVDNTEDTLVTFHIGRGGRFNNPDYKTYWCQDKPIDAYTDDLFMSYENEGEISSRIGDRENLKNLFEEAICGNDAAIERLRGWGLELGDKIYVDCNGSPVGLKVENDGTGCIDEDGIYDTTYVKRLSDCTNEELELIYHSSYFASDDVRNYCLERIAGIWW